MGLARRDAAYHTYGDYLGWPKDARYELIDGVAYLMPPAPTARHQDIVGEIFRQRANALELKGETPIQAPPGVAIEWDRLMARLPATDQ